MNVYFFTILIVNIAANSPEDPNQEGAPSAKRSMLSSNPDICEGKTVI